MKAFDKNLILSGSSIREALAKLNDIPATLTLFVLDSNDILLGSVTDGDIRRGLLNGVNVSDKVDLVMNKNCSSLSNEKFVPSEFKKLKEKGISVLPIVTTEKKFVKLIELKSKCTILPLDAVIMAGGKGERLLPLTIATPKPLLYVGDKPILKHNIDRLSEYGIENCYISVNYLSEKIIDFFKSEEKLSLTFVKENAELGTIGAVSLIETFKNDAILIMNSDLLTNIDFEDMFNLFSLENADIVVASIPYKVQVPYAVLDTTGKTINSFEEKPTLTYYSNAGIYILKKEYVSKIPKNQKYNATDFLDEMIKTGKKVIHYPIYGYWLDIGKHEDYQKAQEDIKHIKF